MNIADVASAAAVGLALGVVTGGWYAAGIDSPANRQFVAAVMKEYGAYPGYYTLGAYSAGVLLEAAALASP